ncbi:MAG: hypothetical protein R2711_18230 [Acidimicrobiales bacterium]
MAATRPEVPVVAGEVVPVGALDAGAIRTVLAAAGGGARPAQDAIAEVAGGSPLLALRLAAGLRPEERAGSRPLPSPLRLPDDVRDAYRPAIEALDAAARRALVVAAADRSGDVDVVRRALEALGGTLDDLAPPRRPAWWCSTAPASRWPIRSPAAPPTRWSTPPTDGRRTGRWPRPRASSRPPACCTGPRPWWVATTCWAMRSARSPTMPPPTAPRSPRRRAGPGRPR